MFMDGNPPRKEQSHEGSVYGSWGRGLLMTIPGAMTLGVTMKRF